MSSAYRATFSSTCLLNAEVQPRFTGNLGPGHKAPSLCVFLGRGLAR
jgi:hypothetical protein